MPDLTMPQWQPGDEIVSGDLNTLSRGVEGALNLRVDPSSGLETMYLPGGTIIRQRRKLECWVKITGGGTSGIYAGAQQLETSSGGWTAGPRSWTTGDSLLQEANGSTTVPTGGTVIVRAWKDRFRWRFVY